MPEPAGSAPYQVIVVGTDGSERAAVAVQEAFAIAKMTGAKLHAVHAVHPVVAVGFTDTMEGAQFDVADKREEVEGLGAQLLAEAERCGVSAEVHNPHGDPADAILSVAEAVDADLVVIGNRGMTGMTRFVLGSVPNKISHHCPCSLLIVNTDRG